MVLLGVMFLSRAASADIPPPNSHYLDYCAKITNLDQFPDIVILGKITGIQNDVTVITNNTCISKGYKFNSISVYWNTKDKGTIVDSSNLLIENMNVWVGYEDNISPLSKETVEYSLAKSVSGKFVLLKTRDKKEFNNGSPALDVAIDSSVDNPPVVPPVVAINKKLKIGMRGDEQVKVLQNYLNTKLNLHLTADGNFGAKTKSAVIVFQQNNGLRGDGVVGAQTVAKMK